MSTYTQQDLVFLSATQALDLFKARKLSPVELMQALIDQAEQHEAKINAFSHRFFEQALEQARAAESRYMKGEPLGKLDGIAVAMKDEIDVAGQPNTEGSLIYESRIAEEDAVLASRLRSAGAIFHARTTCPEFCSLWNTQSRLFGVTRNPWNLDITPGGSSGGSSASLAAATTTLATGSDIGGSIRFPASQCGLVGFKPPFGRVPETYEPFNLERFCANGPMARTVADTALLQNVISGRHPGDIASSLPRVDIPLDFPQSLAGTRIAFSMDLGYLDPEPDIIRNTLLMTEQLKQLGAVVTEVDPGLPDRLEWAYNAHMDHLFYASMAAKLTRHRDLMCDYNIAMTEASLERQRDLSAYYEATCIESQMYAAFGPMMERFDVFICPTAMSNRLKADFNPAHDVYQVNGKTVESDLMLSSCHVFNLMGRCPALSVPSGIGNNGVPTGLQIVAKAYDDVNVFRVAAALESSLGGFPTAPGYQA